MRFFLILVVLLIACPVVFGNVVTDVAKSLCSQNILNKLPLCPPPPKKRKIVHNYEDIEEDDEEHLKNKKSSGGPRPSPPKSGGRDFRSGLALAVVLANLSASFLRF
ncbi:unnamed protein product [Caenorhabditis auriculariae]|uniref:Uncharacterized protein n=1 Tax=Caenorhabditis auriculariae TaxID=2777116 RepID=A0A8S1HJL9_9PELO|nr:unnamed protein product [Caenorhabditis auriculariae]